LRRTREEILSREKFSSTVEWLLSFRFGGAVVYAMEVARRWDVLVAAALMSLISFSLPERQSPDGSSGLDLIALIKLSIRFLVIAWFGSILLLTCFSSLSTRAKRLNRPIADIVGDFAWRGRWTDRILAPWWCFAAWSLVTVLWSPRFTVSLGQWLGLVGVLSFAQVISDRYSQTRSFPWQNLAKQLNIVFAIYSSMVLTAHTLAPSVSGLNRSISFDVGSSGLFHPTAVGATSSLGLTFVGVLFLKRVVENIPVALGMMTIHMVALYYSESRAALAMASVVGIICLIFLMSRAMRASFLLLGGIGLMGLVVLDPGFQLASSRINDVSEYVQRGQTADQLREVSGRAELWELIWEEFKTSPVIGHGYFTTSSTGKLNVWGATTSEDAHNVGLQVLVSTGVVGGIIFVWALLVSFSHLVRSLVSMALIQISQLDNRSLRNSTLFRGDETAFYPEVIGDFVSFTLVVVIWFLGWSQSCVSFLGPIRPEVVAFFAILGLVSAHAKWVATRSSTYKSGLK